MLSIKSPQEYVNEPGVIKKAGEYLHKFGNNALIITGEKSLAAVGNYLLPDLEEKKIYYDVIHFTGYPTLEKAKAYANIAENSNKTVIIAVGGGKIQDVSKAAGSFSGLPVVAIPTIAATCASWAAVSVIYTEEGDFEQYFLNEHSPRLIISDPEIIANAPERYIKAGIVDTIAKWYETVPGITGVNDSLSLQISVHGAKLALDLLEQKGLKAIEENRNGIIGKNAVDTIDAIIYLAGFVGSFIGEKAYSGFAHPFYHASRRIASTRHMLHGELVAFGLITQLILENKPDEQIKNVIKEFSQYDVAFTLADLGLEEDSENKLQIIAERILAEFPGYTKFGFGTTVESIVAAFRKADGYVKQYKVNNLEGAD